MSLMILSKKNALLMSRSAFLGGLILLYFTGYWWPGILLCIWIMLFLRQYFTGRYFDAALTSFILLTLFTLSIFKLRWADLAPIVLTVGGIYIIAREYYFAEDIDGDIKRHEIEDDADITS